MDKENETLLLARDGFGIKPLFYGTEGERFHFGSTIPSVAASMGSEQEIDESSAFNYLAWGITDCSENTFFRNIKCLLPGHYCHLNLKKLSCVNQKIRQNKWWKPEIYERCGSSFDEAAKELRRRFLESVSLHLRSDVKIGAALSGGLDSSAIVCAIRYLEPDIPIHSFSYIAKGTSGDEEKWVDVVNETANCEAHKIFINGIQSRMRS